MPRVAIVGSGLAGSVLCLELQSVAKVTLFERGGHRPERAKSHRLRGRAFGLEATFAYGLGGTTNLWRGCILAMRPDEFGTEWPASVSADVRSLNEAAVAVLYGRPGLELWRSAVASRIDGFEPALVPARPARPATLLRRDRIDLHLDSEVLRVIEEPHGAVVEWVHKGCRQHQRFDLVILAAGALNSPLLLLQSSRCATNVGRNLTDHVMGVVGKVSLPAGSVALQHMKLQNDVRRVPKFRDEETGLWSSFQLCPTRSLIFSRDRYILNANTSNAWSRLHPRYWRFPEMRTEHLIALWSTESRSANVEADVLILAEQEPRNQGSVSLSSGQQPVVEWIVSEQALQAVRRSTVRFINWIGAERSFMPLCLSARTWSGAHHAGTCRLATSSDDGVVDNDLRLHGSKRIFVCDSSVLPSTGASNNGLTITALALRLARHLRLRLQTRAEAVSEEALDA